VATPAWSFTLAPVIPPDANDETLILRDPQPPVPVDSRDLTRRLKLSLLAAASVGLLWALRGFLRRRKTRPFARARWELRSGLTIGHDQESLRRAARSLHRAFDQTFGETLFPGQIERFCQANPAFAPLRGELVAFFQWSQSLFFDPVGATIEPRTHHWLMDLASRFAAAERKAA
jgi:mxaA protein